MSSAEDSPARTSASPGLEPALLANARAYGRSTPVLLARYDRDSSSWKTSQHCLLEGLATYSETWPRSGTMRSGTAYQLPPLVPLTDATDSGLLATPTTKGNQLAPSMMKHPGCRNLWPTPTTRDYKDGAATPWMMQNHKSLLGRVVHLWPTPQANDNRDRGNQSSGAVLRRMEKGKQLYLSQVVSEKSGSLNPTWVEWLMGFPSEWTVCGLWETRSSRKSPKSSGEPSCK
jgi:hypothetical protein